MIQQVPMASEGSEIFHLRCTGSRSRVFSGQLMCSAISYIPGNAFWYEISLYHQNSGAYVVTIKRFTHDEEGIDLFRVFDADDMDSLVSTLEDYEPADDFDASQLGIDDMTASANIVALRAVGLRLKIEEARRQYGDLVGEILYQLVAE
jgi:hypothetical protein